MYTAHCRVLLLVGCLTSGVLSTQTTIIIGRYMYTVPLYSSSSSSLVNQWSPLNSSSYYRSVNVHCTLYSSTCCSLVNQWSPLNSNSFYRSVPLSRSGRSCTLHSSTRCSLINQWSPLNSNSCYRSVHVHCTFLLST